MLQPTRTKHRKQFRGVIGGVATRTIKLAFGRFGLRALSSGWVTSRQIEAARRAMTHYTQRGGRIWIRVFPDKPITKKPAETSMGSGKGEVAGYVAVVRKGTILFEMGAVTKETAREAMRLAGHKLPVATSFVSKVETV